jgi:hypothetical protein
MIRLSGCCAASRFTRLSSVPIAQAEPAGRSLDRLDDELGRAHQVGLEHDLVPALGVHEDVDVGHLGAHGRRTHPAR